MSQSALVPGVNAHGAPFIDWLLLGGVLIRDRVQLQLPAQHLLRRSVPSRRA
jgi:hypothetical protein